VIVNRDLAARAKGEKAETIFRGVLWAGLAEPPNPHVFDLIGLALIRKGLNLYRGFIESIENFHQSPPSLFQ
jgi:hypothetical protein